MKYILIVIPLFLLTSCVIRRKLYSSTQVNNPSLQQKNDHSFAVGFSSPSGFDFNGGFALTNRLAIIAGAYTHRNNNQQTATNLFSDITTNASLLYRHKGYHGGIGFYFPLSKKNSSYASFFGGYIKGNFRMDEDGTETDNSTGMVSTRNFFYKSDLGRYFFQGAFNSYIDRFEISLLSRYNYVEYNNVTTNYSPSEQQEFSLPGLGYSKNSQFLDFAFDSKYFFNDSKKVGMQLYGSLTARLNQKEINFPYYVTRFGVGIVVKNWFNKSAK